MRPQADHGEQSYAGLGRLTGRTALITGGDSGIGRAVAIAFAREGADVAISYLPEEERDARESCRWVVEAGRRALALRFTGDDVRWQPRPYMPMLFEPGLEDGDPMDCDFFPRVWSSG